MSEGKGWFSLTTPHSFTICGHLILLTPRQSWDIYNYYIYVYNLSCSG